MPEQRFQCELDRDQALHVERRYGVHWAGGTTLDTAEVGDGAVPGITFRIEFQDSTWPRATVITLGWDDQTDPDQEKLHQLRGQLDERGVKYVEL